VTEWEEKGGRKWVTDREEETEVRREGENYYKQTHTVSKDGKWRKRGTYNRKRKSRRHTDKAEAGREMEQEIDNERVE